MAIKSLSSSAMLLDLPALRMFIALYPPWLDQAWDTSMKMHLVALGMQIQPTEGNILQLMATLMWMGAGLMQLVFLHQNAWEMSETKSQLPIKIINSIQLLGGFTHFSIITI